MNETQTAAKALVDRKEAEVNGQVKSLKLSRSALRKAQRALDKEILADPHAWVESVAKAAT